jgi:hypothetical protein
MAALKSEVFKNQNYTYSIQYVSKTNFSHFAGENIFFGRQMLRCCLT